MKHHTHTKKHTLTQNYSLNTSELEDQKLKIIPGCIASSRPAYTIQDTFQTNLQANGIAIPGSDWQAS